MARNLKRYFDEKEQHWVSIVDDRLTFIEDNYFFPMYRSYGFSLKNYHSEEIRKNPIAYRERCLRHMSIEVRDLEEWNRARPILKIYPIEIFITGVKEPWETEVRETEYNYSF